jgi:hypothetical protein
MSEMARATGAKLRTICMSSLGREVASAMLEGSVVAVVSSRRDAAAALKLGADETVRVAQSVTLRKSTLESAIARARSHSLARVASSPCPEIRPLSPALTGLLRAVEPRLGRPLDAAAARCAEVADELTRMLAIFDGLLQRVQMNAQRDEIPGWFREVEDCARATLRLETLVSSLQEEVHRSEAVMKLLGTLSLDASAPETDAVSLLEKLAEIVQSGLPTGVVCEFIREGAACIVSVPLPSLICFTCTAVEAALENVLSGKSTGRVTLRASAAHGEAIIQVADNAPGSIDVRAITLDSFHTDERTARLRELREWTRRLGGDLTVDADDAGNVISICLPAMTEPKTNPLRQSSTLRFERSSQ